MKQMDLLMVHNLFWAPLFFSLYFPLCEKLFLSHSVVCKNGAVAFLLLHAMWLLPRSSDQTSHLLAEPLVKQQVSSHYWPNLTMLFWGGDGWSYLAMNNGEVILFFINLKKCLIFLLLEGWKNMETPSDSLFSGHFHLEIISFLPSAHQPTMQCTPQLPIFHSLCPFVASAMEEM